MNFTSPEEILAYAAEKEKEAVAFYLQLSENETVAAAKKQFLEFAEEEKRHQAMFENYLADPAQVADYQFSEIEDLKISDYLVEESYSPKMDYAAILRLAMKKEEKAVKFFQDMAASVSDENLRKVFQVLINEEQTHKNILETLYDEYLKRVDF